jgi:serine/threonine protein kinase
MVGHDNQDLVGQVLDRKYKISGLIGQGGMGCVYRGEHVHLKRQCAVKVIRRQHTADPVALKRFQLEAEAASILKHPNIIEIYDFGITQDELAYIVMELLSGESLDDLIERHKFIHYQEALPIFLQICDALAHAHSRKVLHRDLKPPNIMVINSESGELQVKLVDFGIAKLLPGTDRSVEKLTQTGEVFGSPMYMSPEQCMGQPLDFRSDVYALGCVLYQTLTGKLPFVGDNFIQIVVEHLNAQPRAFAEVAPNVAIPQDLEEITRRCLAKDRAIRFASMTELKNSLLNIYAGSKSPDTIQATGKMTLPATDSAACADSGGYKDSGGYTDSSAYAATSDHAGKTGDTGNVCEEDSGTYTDDSGDSNSQEEEEEEEEEEPNTGSPSDDQPADDTAAQILLSEITWLQKRHGKTSSLVIAPLSDLYNLYKDRSEFSKALEVMQRILPLIGDACNEDLLLAAMCHDEAGQMQMKLQSFSSAEASFRESLSLRINYLGSDAYDTCKVRIRLAGALLKRDRLAEAQEIVEDASVRIRRSAGDSSLDTAAIERMAGDFYDDVDRQPALKHYEAAYKIVRILWGDRHIDLRGYVMDMARSSYFIEQYQNAVNHCLEAIEINRANPEVNDLQVEHPWSFLALSYYRLGMLEKAEQAFLTANKILEERDDVRPSYLAQNFNSLADIYEDMRKADRAAACRKRASRLEAIGD